MFCLWQKPWEKVMKFSQQKTHDGKSPRARFPCFQYNIRSTLRKALCLGGIRERHSALDMDHRTYVMNDELFMSMLVIELSITTSQFFRSQELGQSSPFGEQVREVQFPQGFHYRHGLFFFAFYLALNSFSILKTVSNF